MVTLTLGSFNLLSGRSLSDGLIRPERLAAAIEALDVDVLAVQEVERHQPRSGGTDQPALIASTLGAVDGRFAATLRGTPGEPGWTPSSRLVRPGDDGGGDGSEGVGGEPEFGVALFSRLPVAEWHVLRLEPARGRYPIPIPSRPPRIIRLNDEPRVALAAVLEHPRLTVACTHLSFVPPVAARQLAQVRDWLAGLPGPRLLLGDLNLPPWAARRVTGGTALVTRPTFPSPFPRLQLDHVLATGLPPGTRSVGRVRPMPISDHRAVRVELDLPALTRLDP